MTVRFTPTSVAATRRALERVMLEIVAVAPTASVAGGKIVATDMAAQAPHDTGALASSIVVESDGATAHVGPTVPYARFVQYGTQFMVAQPFATQAAEDVKSKVVTTIAAYLKAVIH